MSTAQQFRVLADYDVHEPHPLEVAAGQEVTLLKKDLSWPGWVWIQCGERDGWIPESYLKDPSADETVALRGFDGKDLSAKRGDLLSVIESAPGWIYARNGTGIIGWFPLFNLKPVQHT